MANVCIVGPDAVETRILVSSLRSLVNAMWGYTATQAARIVVTIINNPALAAEWWVTSRDHVVQGFLGITQYDWPIEYNSLESKSSTIKLESTF